MIHEPVTKAAAGQCVCSLAVTGHRICSAHEQTWWEYGGVTTESVLCGTCGHYMDCHGIERESSGLVVSEAVVRGLVEALESKTCPRPCNGRPDFLSVRTCVEYGECGCGASAALAAAKEAK